MRPRQVILFLLIVLVPLAIAAWLGLKVARDEEQVSRHQFRGLLEGRLRDVEATISRTLGDAERHLLEHVITADRVDPSALSEADIDALRDMRRSEPLVREVFVLDADGRLVFPPDGDAASRDERAFRNRTAPIWRGDAVLYEPPAPERATSPATAGQSTGQSPARAAPNRPAFSGEPRAQGDTVLALAQTHEQGWITWYWEEGLHLLFWRRLDSGAIGVEVERVVLLARIVAKLPAASLDDGRVVLVDSRGNPMHQWGPHEPEPDEQPVATLPVTYPLNAWRLRHYASAGQTQAFFAGTLRLNLILGLAAVALALLAMAGYFYRDYARKMRDAAERVSFVTQVSHELKTPLTNIRLYAELIESDLIDEEDEQTCQRLSVIVAESQRLTRLINNILAFSKQRRHQLELHRAWIQLDDIIEAVMAHFAPALDARGIAPTVTGGAPDPIYADPDVIGQIIANLVSNVEKYAAGGGVVEVATAQDDRATTVRVSDRGPGIAPSQRDKVFRPFYRISDRLTDGVTGTGIGLSIARELARLSGGELRLVAAEVGACFELTLPRRRESLPHPTDRGATS